MRVLHSSLAICLAGFLAAVSVPPVRASDSLSKLIAAVEAAGYPLPSERTLRSSCDSDSLCVAKFLRDRIGAGAELVPFEAPQRRTVDWNKNAPAPLTSAMEPQGTLVLTFKTFDAKAVLAEINAAAPPPARLVLDVGGVGEGTSLDRMRRVLALFVGAKERVFTVRHVRGQDIDWTLVAPSRMTPEIPVVVRVDATAGAEARLFARAMRRHAGAVIEGPLPDGPMWIRKRVPVMPGWALMVPTAELLLAPAS